MEPVEEREGVCGEPSPSRKRILFVDDEPFVLAGLRNVLRRHRHRWDMVFVEDGEAALAELAQGHVDVVVSDMRMPRMDGVELLEKVRDGHPAVTRIMLSGQIDGDILSRALLVAHQFLNKPCEADVLPRVIERACALAAILSDDELRRLAGGIGRLPSLPKVYWELSRLIARQDTGVAEIARVVEQDPIVAARVLQIVNSGYFGLQRAIPSIREAVNLMGNEMLRGLLLSSAVFRAAVDAKELGGLDYQHLQAHSVATGRLASRIAKSPQDAQRAATAGLLHDLGMVVLALGFPERFSEISASLGRAGARFDQLERDHAGICHAAIGGYMLGLWGLPAEVVDAVALHHAPAECTSESGRLGVVGAVHVADALISERCPSPGTSPFFAAEIDASYLESIGATAQLDLWRAMAEQDATR